jgi:hypothetical protein
MEKMRVFWEAKNLTFFVASLADGVGLKFILIVIYNIHSFPFVSCFLATKNKENLALKIGLSEK